MKKLMPCFTIVIYFGEEPWDGPRSLKDMLLDDFQTDIKYVFGILQNTRSGNGLKQFVEENSEQFENLEEDAYDVISMMSHSKELEVIKEHAQGFSDTRIAEKCGISVEKVKYILDDSAA